MGGSRDAGAPVVLFAVSVGALPTVFGTVGVARAGVTPEPGAATLERLVTAYHAPIIDPSRRAWRELLADPAFATAPIDVLEFVKLEHSRGAKVRYERYVTALTAALRSRGASMITVNDTLRQGLATLPGYRRGVSWLARFPSLHAYVETVLDHRVVVASQQRRIAVAEAQTRVGGELRVGSCPFLGNTTGIATGIATDDAEGQDRGLSVLVHHFAVVKLTGSWENPRAQPDVTRGEASSTSS